MSIVALREELNTAWLIEWPGCDNMPARWWHPVTGWMLDANKATRFSREEDAQAFIETSQFCAGVIPTEHIFLSSAPHSGAANTGKGGK